ncbi:carboxypeptidase-like regulatory domain-containing protein [Micromonospora zamorensis]|uniref:carboxypeptidase-like regulatory domain-containing protein n=1 Tax=Micromonospora zamorensis TaxID=709883 RepID=UPI0033B348A5
MGSRVARPTRRTGTLLLAALSALLLLGVDAVLGSVAPVWAGSAAATVSGTLTERAGRPASQVRVTLAPDSGAEHPTYSTTTDRAGRWRVSGVSAGRYRITNQLPGVFRPRYYPSRLGFPWGAVTVPTRGRLVVDDVLPPAGRIRFVAADAATGSEVRNFCVQDPLELGLICTNPAGTFPNGYLDLEVPPGHYRFTGTANDGVHEGGMVEATAVAGRVTHATLPVQPPGNELRVTLRDRATGAPVPNTGIIAISVDKRFPDIYDANEISDENGVVRFRSLHPDRYNIWAGGSANGHGAQWVGPKGGTGDRAKALVVEPGPGITTLPDILLDPAGSITGSITDAVTGQPVSVTVALTTYDPFWYETTWKVSGNGSYTFSGLGPYEWSLAFIPPGNGGANSGYATQWSGGAPNSVKATRITVVAGGTTVANERMSAGTAVSGQANGLPVYGYSYPVYVYNADTGDIVAVDENVEDGRYDARLLPGQRVRFCLHRDRCYPDYVRQVDASAIRVGTSPFTVDFPGRRG